MTNHVHITKYIESLSHMPMAHIQRLSVVVVFVTVLSDFFPLIPYFPRIGKNLGPKGP